MAAKGKTSKADQAGNVESLSSAAASGAAAESAENAAEAITERAEEERAGQQDAKSQHAKDVANLRQMAAWHGAAAVAALTLFGAAHTWAAVSGLVLAAGTSIAAAFLAGMVLSPLFHEWGHFAGARLSGAVSPVLEKPYKLFFMFRFDMQGNSTRQVLWMSWGGNIGSWLLPVGVLLLVPLDSFASAMLLATAVGQAFNASLFEVPVIFRTRETGEFETALNQRLKTVGVRQMPGFIVGLITLAALT